jgi:predicted nucleotide-binding protein
MMQSSSMAFLVCTAEDEREPGVFHARENVIHEAGLFQGRLSFERAIIMLEEDCKGFSNIEGLTVIYFPSNDIAASFEKVRGVLQREGFLNGA